MGRVSRVYVRESPPRGRRCLSYVTALGGYLVGFAVIRGKVSPRESRLLSSTVPRGPRSARTGQTTDRVQERPSNQSPQFFGTSSCFVFKAVSSDPSTLEVFKGKSSLNSNFMYLFDVHPDQERVGIAMGGQVQRHAWFLDRWLEAGHCANTCTTFGSPNLCSISPFSVDAVEVYSVNPENFAPLLERHAADENRRRMREVEVDGEDTEAAPSVLRQGAETNCNKMLLELNGMHQFDAVREDCC